MVWALAAFPMERLGGQGHPELKLPKVGSEKALTVLVHHHSQSGIEPLPTLGILEHDSGGHTPCSLYAFCQFPASFLHGPGPLTDLAEEASPISSSGRAKEAEGRGANAMLVTPYPVLPTLPYPTLPYHTIHTVARLSSCMDAPLLPPSGWPPWLIQYT